MPVQMKITKRAVDAAKPAEREYTVWDTEIPGFGLRVYPSGRKSYCLKFRVGGGRGGTIRKPSIGVHGSITPDQARSIAQDWSADVRLGRDPSYSRSEKRRAPTMGELFGRYMLEHAIPRKKASSSSQDEMLIRVHLTEFFGDRKVAEVSRADIDRLHKSLSHIPYRANRALSMLSKCFALSEVWGWRPEGSNPTRYIERFREARRERLLSETELQRLGMALRAADEGKLGAISPFGIAAIRVLALTGARRNEVLGLKWTNVDLSAGMALVEDSKTGRKWIVLPPAAVEILARLPRKAGNPFVFVGRKAETRLADLKRPWDRVRESADLQDVRLHDLRHCFASVGASGGTSLLLIGKLLGHSQLSTTQRYAHLADDPVRAAAASIGRQIASAMQLHESSAVGGDETE